MDPKLASFLSEAGELPPLPPAAARAVALTEDPGTGSEELRRAVETDPALAARVLQAANSPLYGFARNIDTLGHAVTALGPRAVRNLVLATSLRRMFSRFGRVEELLIDHAQASAVCARLVARQPGVGLDPEEAFAAGLLHDLGKVALAAARPRDYEAVVDRAIAEGAPFAEVERAVFGFDHGEAGFRVAIRMGLPRRLVAAVRFHHAPGRVSDPDDARLAAAASVATALATRLGHGRGRPAGEVDPCAAPGYARLGLLPDDAPRLVAAAGEALKRVRVPLD